MANSRDVLGRRVVRLGLDERTELVALVVKMFEIVVIGETSYFLLRRLFQDIVEVVYQLGDGSRFIAIRFHGSAIWGTILCVCKDLVQASNCGLLNDALQP